MLKGMFIAVMACAMGLLASGCSMKSSDQSKAMMAPPGDIIEVATGPGMEQVTTLVTAVKAAGLVDTLKGPGPYTVFAPTNEAFAKLPPGTLDMLLKPENKDKLKNILLYHVVEGKYTSAQLMKMDSVKAVNGETLHLKMSGDHLTVGNDKDMSTVTRPDIQASNGTIHWVDTVMMP